MDYNRVFRTTVLAACACAGVVIVLALLQLLVVPLLVLVAPSVEPALYDWGVFGAYPTKTYVSFNLTAPQTSIVKWDDSCDNGLVFLDPSGPSVPHRGPLILDAKGDLVWTSDQFASTANQKIQEYQGQEYLTFWSGTKAKTSGAGAFVLLNPDYTVAHRVDAVGEDLHGDLHEFKITSDDTALMSVYTMTQADLTGMGWFRSERGWITDSFFQEVDIATGELRFEWRPSDHFRPEDSFMVDPIGGYTDAKPFDFFHLNSVEKDARGNFLVSSRHFHAVYYVDGVTGDVLWSLGGRQNNFTDLSDGRATDFSWQHDARWLSEDDGILSLFDNSYAWPHSNAPYSQGRIIQLDRDNFTATLLHSFLSLQHARSSSQGSVQMLPAGRGEPHTFIGWGSSAAYSEFTSEGQLLCEAHFAASALFWWERVKSYRAFKALTWTATPAAWDPSAQIQGGRLYVSWNGATSVAAWELQGCHDADSRADDPDPDPDDDDDRDVVDWVEVDVLDKESFEESFALPSGDDAYAHYRVAALDADRNVLRYSNVATPSASDVGSYVFAAIAAVICAVAAAAYWLVRRRGWHLDWRQYAQFTVDRSKYQKLW